MAALTPVPDLSATCNHNDGAPSDIRALGVYTETRDVHEHAKMARYHENAAMYSVTAGQLRSLLPRPFPTARSPAPDCRCLAGLSWPRRLHPRNQLTGKRSVDSAIVALLASASIYPVALHLAPKFCFYLSAHSNVICGETGTRIYYSPSMC